MSTQPPLLARPADVPVARRARTDGATPPRRAAVVVVGAGPTGIGVLERLAAQVLARGAGAGAPALDVHLVDPHLAGSGRVWRSGQSSLLWANSLVADVTVLPDEAATTTAPPLASTTLAQWIDGVGVHLPCGDPVGDEARRLTPTSFPSRPLVGAYLRWVLDRVAQLAAGADAAVAVHEHSARAVEVLAPGEAGDGAAAVVVLDDGTHLPADAVVLAQGHLDVEASPSEQDLARAADRAGLTYLATAYTADADLSGLAPGQDVIVRGAGLAFVDLMVLLTSGRGGTFSRDGGTGRLRYTPSGREPVLHVGSRRGVPYRSKLGYAGATKPGPLRFFTPAEVDRRFGRPVDLRADASPLITAELAHAHYRQLFTAHPERTRGTWEDLAGALADAVDTALATGTPLPGTVVAADVAAAAVPDPADRFDLAALDRPLAGVHGLTGQELQELLRRHTTADVARRSDPAHDEDAAVFTALLACHGTVLALAATGRLTPRSQAQDVTGWWMNLFSYLASGPPGPRLEELVALSEAGVVRFLGADVQVRLEESGDRAAFVATSATTEEAVRAGALVEARLPTADIAATTDVLVRSLLRRGRAREQVIADEAAPGGRRPTGRLLVQTPTGCVVPCPGTAPLPVFALGTWTSSGPVAAFVRPGTDGPFFRQNDAVAAGVLVALGERVRTA